VYLNFKGESMKKVLLVVMAFLFVNVQAGDELTTRKFLKIDSAGKQYEELPLKVGNRKFMIGIKEYDTFVIVSFGGNTFKSENGYFELLTKWIHLFLMNYKIGNISQKKIYFTFNSKNYPNQFEISTNNLRLLENRDFGRKDFFISDDNKFVLYPLKTILNKGKFKTSGTFDNDMTKRYKEFLTTYDIDLTEGGLERIYRKSKIK